MPTLNIHNEDIYYEIEGSGSPLVLIHSLGTSSALWRDQIAHWKSRYTVVAMDARGHGKSSSNGGVTIESVAADLLALMDRLQLGASDVIGISMGGLIATHLYTAAPEKVRSIALADTFVKIPEAQARAAIVKQKLQSVTMVEFGKEYASQTLLPTTAAQRHQELGDWVANMSPRAYSQTVDSLFMQDVGALMSGIKVPTLVVVGEMDHRTPITMANEIMDLIPGARLETVPEAGHLGNIDNPAAFHRAIDPFLESRR